MHALVFKLGISKECERLLRGRNKGLVGDAARASAIARPRSCFCLFLYLWKSFTLPGFDGSEARMDSFVNC